MNADDDLQLLEEALLGQWSHFGSSTESGLEDDGQLIWTEAPIRHLPYNTVLKTQIDSDPVGRIRAQVARFEKRQVHFLWVVNPTARPSDLEEILVGEGLSLIAREIGMSVELDGHDESLSWERRGITYKLAANAGDIADFESLTMEYWGLPEEISGYVHQFTWRAFVRGDCGCFFLAYRGCEPVGKAFLSTIGRPGTSSLWAVFVKPEARGLGIGSHLTRLALSHAARIGRQRVVLMSTQMGRPVYKRHGFREVCEIPVYADTPTLTTLQGIQPA